GLFVGDALLLIELLPAIFVENADVADTMNRPDDIIERILRKRLAVDFGMLGEKIRFDSEQNVDFSFVFAFKLKDFLDVITKLLLRHCNLREWLLLRTAKIRSVIADADNGQSLFDSSLDVIADVAVGMSAAEV